MNLKTRKHSNGMRTARLPTERPQYPPDVRGISPQVKQVSSLGHQISLAGGVSARVPVQLGSMYVCMGEGLWWGLGGPCRVRSHAQGTGGENLYGEVQCIMGNVHMGPLVDRQRRLKSLPSHNFFGGQ